MFHLFSFQDMGFSKNACEAALKNGKTISLALEDLLPGNPDAVNLMVRSNLNLH